MIYLEDLINSSEYQYYINQTYEYINYVYDLFLNNKHTDIEKLIESEY